MECEYLGTARFEKLTVHSRNSVHIVWLWAWNA
jgi:hypothetical protein